MVERIGLNNPMAEAVAAWEAVGWCLGQEVGRHRHRSKTGVLGSGRTGSDLAKPAIATRLDVVTLRADVLACASFKIHQFASGTRSWLSHHER